MEGGEKSVVSRDSRSHSSMPPVPGILRVLVHDKRIRTWMVRAYYEVLNDDETFRPTLADLLNHWTWSAAERFARRWHLPHKGVADLRWTYSLWREGLLRAPCLQVGSRSLPWPGTRPGRREGSTAGLSSPPAAPEESPFAAARSPALVPSGGPQVALEQNGGSRDRGSAVACPDQDRLGRCASLGRGP